MLLCMAHLLGALQAVLEFVDDDDALGAPGEGALRRQDAHCRSETTIEM